MTRGFHRLVVAQFLSGLADHALLLVALAFLLEQGFALWWAPLLKFAFTLSFVALAPLIGELTDAFPKQRVMFWTQCLKLTGVAGFLVGLHPLVAFALVGAGAACYSPAKYGWVTEQVRSADLVKANGWLEVSMVCAVLLGTVGGGWLISGAWDWTAAMPFVELITPTRLIWAFAILILAYIASAALTLSLGGSLPRRACNPIRPFQMFGDFARANMRLWRDPLASLSLIATCLMWGSSVVMQLAVLHWGTEVMGMTLDQSAYLQAVVAIGIVIGAVLVSRRITMRRAVNVWPMGLLMGMLLPLAAWIETWQWAVPVILLVGVLGAVIVVPMNALLQYRGYKLLRPGLSIAAQGFGENISILVMLALYWALLSNGASIASIMIGLGLLVTILMAFLGWRVHRLQGRRSTEPQAGYAKGFPSSP